MRLSNPITFTQGPVTFWTTLIYFAFILALILVHELLPKAPAVSGGYEGVNVTEAWSDLAAITKDFHPFNSRANDEVRAYLLRRIQEIAGRDGVKFETEESLTVSNDPPTVRGAEASPAVTIFDDRVSNVTFLRSRGLVGSTIDDHTCNLGTYFESANILVYIRGSEDEEGEWWKRGSTGGGAGVLVNAHFDSVATGRGATDDGIGVVVILQLISHFSRPGNQPKHGIIALLNDGEEDGLLGAYSLANHPLLPFIHTFLNLEGAGAGGRALLFRTTDGEVTRAYSNTPHPFGSVLAADAFKLGLVKSGTDYSVWYDIYGQRGLDLAFFKPRARYHTDHDDMPHASRESLWHMLSASLETVKSLSGDLGDKFVGERGDGDTQNVQNGAGTPGVWFDLFGQTFLVFKLQSLFAWSVTLLVASPLILAAISYGLFRADKYYLFSSTVSHPTQTDGEAIALDGWRGFSRLPLALFGSTLVVSLACFLVARFNPMIVYSSSYAVWCMALSLFFSTTWAIMKVANASRPSALHRCYSIIWLYSFSWILLVGATVIEKKYDMGATYIIVVLQVAVFLAMVVGLGEMFALPSKQEFAQSEVAERSVAQLTSALSQGPEEEEPLLPPNDQEEEASQEESRSAHDRLERVGSDTSHRPTTFTTGYRSSSAAAKKSARTADRPAPFEKEQAWSGSLPTWTWFLQFLLLAPVNIILMGQVALFATASVAQTLADGSSVAIPYAIIAALSVLLLIPTTPFIHRVPSILPLLLLVVFITTFVYNMVAFPFSPASRYKAYFQQNIDLDDNTNTVDIMGIEEFVRPIVAELPSAAGQLLTCTPSEGRPALSRCRYEGSLALPNLDPDDRVGQTLAEKYGNLISLNVTRKDSGVKRATLSIDAKESKMCYLTFKKTVTKIEIEGGTEWTDRFGEFPTDGLCQFKLWRRDYNHPWTVNIEWNDEDAFPPKESAKEDASEDDDSQDNEELKVRDIVKDGDVVCVWSDANKRGTIPALDECWQYAPLWTGMTKMTEGLVEVKKGFVLA